MIHIQLMYQIHMFHLHIYQLQQQHHTKYQKNTIKCMIIQVIINQGNLDHQHIILLHMITDIVINNINQE